MLRRTLYKSDKASVNQTLTIDYEQVKHRAAVCEAVKWLTVQRRENLVVFCWSCVWVLSYSRELPVLAVNTYTHTPLSTAAPTTTTWVVITVAFSNEDNRLQLTVNRLQLDSVPTSVNIDHLTTVDNTSAVGNNSCPWVVPQSIKWLSSITREREIPPDSVSGGIPHLFGTFLSPHIRSGWRARHDSNNSN